MVMAVKAKVRGGAKLRAYMRQLERNSETARVARVGFLEGSTYTDGTPVAEIASIQEFGASIDHPGGTKYITDAVVGKRGAERIGTRFVGKSFQGETKTTAAHKIVIPPRPFFRTAIAKNKQAWADALAASMKDTGMDAATSLERVSDLMVSNIQQSITDWSDPPNAPSTIRKKKYNNPLIDTRTMYRAVAYEVK
ncbi:hypothetical protein NBRC3280_2890 [Acetobacter pasteurianus NBRC 3280]|uniref:Uncharacterized protein n=2 Tax=Acetobacter pasteurianus TaxID=438 RepID=A0A401X859_ACEPA|nr:hypothetical protein [Acetobacter pasteurianus]GCD60272.1 hypothetical protein NBRC3277_2847 [Acetobacter pasteurianus NBRC 3277]GCD63917.1 hypothetical protein NBRC3278_3010 [Acetobacter pasteurianus NBRC 3278]GCD70255.1 hypothetical protein NBRC3280_2890 [Acetobacter pasteurianus NBRC 3280]